MAQYIFKHMLEERHIEDRFVVESAATSREEIGNGVHYGTRQKLRLEGVPCGDHRAVCVTRKDYDEYDYLIVMDSNNIRNLMRIIGDDTQGKVSMLLDYAGRNGESIADPWYTGDFDETFDDICMGCEGLLQHLGF